ncbi:MAG: hypothetical protein K2O91_02490 [Lachnospiraceae bacterium]|nr:hypothetical protein [Lachnospiraceae bacterium]
MERDKKQNTANLDKLTKIFMHLEMEPDCIKLPLEALDSSNWEKYESAGDARIWLQKLMDGEDEAFSECCDEISHQMSFWSAIYLVFPYLVDKLAKDFDQIDPGEWIMNSSMLGISLATDCDINRGVSNIADKAVMSCYQLSIRKFQLLIKKFLTKKAKSLSRVDSMDKAMFALEVLAAFGNRDDAFLLVNAELDQGICLACDKCEHCNEELEFMSKRTLSGIIPKAQAEDSWNGEDFEDTYLWFGDFLELFTIKGLAKHLPYYFGTYKCPECGSEAVVKDLMKNFYSV